SLKSLKELNDKKCPTVSVYYVTSDKGPSEFAAHSSADNKACSVSLYFGHGSGKEEVAEIKKSIGGKNVPAGEMGACQAPRYGFYSCFAGIYNQAVNPENRVASPSKLNAETVGPEIAKEFKSNFEALKQMINDMCTKCCNMNVKLRLYFGQQE